jgi:hypothetical protein
MTAFAIRTAEPADAGELAALRVELGDDVTTEQATARLTSLDAGHEVFLAESEGRVLGFVHVHEGRALAVGWMQHVFELTLSGTPEADRG